MAEFGNIKCLIIDDDEDDFFIAESALLDIKTHKHETQWASDYESAEQELESGEFDVCLVDYRIGPSTGLEFIKDMIARGCRVPMILLTGMSDDAIDQEAARAGAFDFIEKSALESRVLERSIRYSIAQAAQMRKLQNQTTLLRATLEHTGAGIAAFNQNRHLETYNRRLLEILEVPEDEISELEQHQGDEIPLHVTDIIASRLKCFEAAATLETEVEMPGGRTIEVRNNIAPDGRQVIVCTDITERKEAELDLIASREAAIEADKAKSEFLANMSHELRTPLNAVIGFSEMLKQLMVDERADAKWIEYADDITNSGKRLLDLINDVLQVSKIDFGKYEIAEQDLYVTDIFNFCKKQIDHGYRDREPSVVFESPDKDLAITCDNNLVNQALLNLLSNAVKFTPGGGAIVVSAKRNRSNEVIIAVSDEGIGMSEEELSKCLEPFGQADGSLTRRFEGTGLGLPLVQRYAALHGGRLEIQTEKDVGTTALFILPARRLALSEASGQADGASHKASAA